MHQLSINEMPAHTHSVVTVRPYGSANGENPYLCIPTTTITGSAGGNQPHQNMPPFQFCNFIIKAQLDEVVV